MQLPKKDKLLKIFVAIALFLSFLAIGSIDLDKNPVFDPEEMAFGLGAYNISQTGYDLCGSKFPLFPCCLNIFPFQSTTFSYYTNALFYKFYTPSGIFGIRIFSVLIGALTGIFSLLFFRRLFKSQKNGFIYAIALSIIFYLSPAVLTMQRYGAPYFIISLLLQMILFFLIYEFYRTNKKILLFFIPLVASVLMFEYQLYRLFAPFYVLIFVLIFRNEVFAKPDPEINKLGYWAKIKFIISENKYILSGLSVLSFVSLTIYNQVINDSFTTKFYLVKHSYPVAKLMIDYLFHFSTIPFYFYYNLNSFFFSYKFGLFTASSAIFFIFGLIWILKNIKQNNFFKFLLISFLSYPIPSAVLGYERFVSHRIMNVIPIYFIIMAYGVSAFLSYAGQIKKNPLNTNKIPALLLSSAFWFAVIAGHSAYFMYDYFYKMPERANYCQFGTEVAYNCNMMGLFDYLKKEKSNYSKIYLDENLIFVEAYTKFFNEFEGYNINSYETINIRSDNNFIENSIVVTSKKASDELNLESKYKLIKTIDEINSQNKYFYVFLIEK